MKRFLLVCFFAAAAVMTAAAQDIQFDDYFVNKTLRLDYVFSGTSAHQTIAVDELASLPTWAGRRHNLDKLPLKGNGQIIVADSASHKIIYETSFSSLFLEYLGTEEAVTKERAFQNTFLVPFPKQPVEITVTIYNASQKPISELKHFVNPKDILIHKKGESHLLPSKYIVKSGSPEQCIDVAIVAEGYTEKEMDTFYKDAEITAESLFSYEPFKSNKGKFNIVAVGSPSVDSGVSIPRLGEWKNTCFGSNFSTFYSDRYLTSLNIKSIHDALVGVPYEHIIVLVNTEEYGGGGVYNEYDLTAAHHPLFRPVVVHEFGHSFGGLADEYFYEHDVMTDTYDTTVEPWEPNVTTRVNFTGKWENLIKPNVQVPTVVEKIPVEITATEEQLVAEAEKSAAALHISLNSTSAGSIKRYGNSFIPKNILRVTLMGTLDKNGKLKMLKGTPEQIKAKAGKLGLIKEQYESREKGVLVNTPAFGNNKLQYPGELPVGIYEGAAYSFKGVYRGSYDCRMRTNQYPTFCPVCQQAIQRIIDFYTK
jgi:hypothetical protein